MLIRRTIGAVIVLALTAIVAIAIPADSSFSIRDDPKLLRADRRARNRDYADPGAIRVQTTQRSLCIVRDLARPAHPCPPGR